MNNITSKLNDISKLRVTKVSNDDWNWLYVNGKLTEYEGHDLTLDNLSDAINDYIDENSNGSYVASIHGIIYQEWCVNQEYGESGLPKLLKDIPEDMFE